jgi:4-carboxymuconolactone decarboxylase
MLLTDPYRAGLEVIAQTGAGQDPLRNRAAEVAPDFVRLAIGFSYGEIFSRPGLDLKYRVLAAISAHAAMAISPTQLRTHVAAALHLGWTRAEIIEVLIQTASHAGMPAALNALAECHALLVERDPDCQSCGEASSEGQL